MQGLRWQRAVGWARAGAWLELRLGSGLGSTDLERWMEIQGAGRIGGFSHRGSPEKEDDGAATPGVDEPVIPWKRREYQR